MALCPGDSNLYVSGLTAALCVMMGVPFRLLDVNQGELGSLTHSLLANWNPANIRQNKRNLEVVHIYSTPTSPRRMRHLENRLLELI
jgi:hypothetical protein